MEGRVSILLGSLHASRTVSFCFSFSHVARYAPSWKTKVTTQVVVCWLGILFFAPRRGNLRVAQSRAKRRPGCCRPSPAFALQGQKRKNQRLLFVHTLHLLYMLLPLQGESTAHCIHHPGRRFALPWATSRLPLRGVQTASFHPQLVPSQTGFFGQKAT